MKVVELNEGRKIEYELNGTKLDFADGTLTVNLAKYQRDSDITKTVIGDKDGNLLLIDKPDTLPKKNADGRFYVAIVEIPATEYGLHLHLFWCPLHPWRFCVRHRKWTLPSVCMEKYAPGRKREDRHRSALPQHRGDHCAERHHFPAQGPLGRIFRPLVRGSHGGVDDHRRL